MTCEKNEKPTTGEDEADDEIHLADQCEVDRKASITVDP